MRLAPTRRALPRSGAWTPTNKVDDYENLYTLFFEVLDGTIHTQVEMLDFRVSAEKFDLSALEQR